MAPLLEETLSRDIRPFPSSSPSDAAKMVQVARGEAVPPKVAEREPCISPGESDRPTHRHASGGNGNGGCCSPSSSFFTSSTDGLQLPQQSSSSPTIPSGKEGENGQTRVFNPWGGDLTFLPPPPPPFQSGTSDDVSPSPASSSCSSSVSARSQDCVLSSFEKSSQKTTLMVQEEGEVEPYRVSSPQTEKNSPEHEDVSNRGQDIASGSSIHSGDGADGKTDVGEDMSGKIGGKGSDLESPQDGDLIIQHTRDAIKAGFANMGEGDAFVYPATEDGQNGDHQYTQCPTRPLLSGGAGQETPSTGCHSKDNDDAMAICNHPLGPDKSGVDAQKEGFSVEKGSREITNINGPVHVGKDFSRRHQYTQYGHAERSLSSVAEKGGVGRGEGSCGSNATELHHVLQQQTGEQRRDFQQAHDRYRGQVFEGDFIRSRGSPQGCLATERLEGKQPPPPPPSRLTMPGDPQQLLQYEHRELLLKLLASTASPAPPGRTGIAPCQLRPQDHPVNGSLLSSAGRRLREDNLASDALRCFMRNRSLNTHTDYGNSTGMGYLDSTQSSRPHGGGGLNCSSIPTMANIGTAGAPATLTAGEGVGDGRRERGDEGRWEGQQQGRRNERARCFGTPDQGPGGVLVGNSAGGVSRVMGGYQQKQLANEGRDDLFQVKAYRGNANHFSNSHTAAPGTSHHTNSSHVGSCGEVDDVDPFYKTKMCPFMKGGRRTCPKEGNCTFAHSSAELRAPPDFRKTKLCRYSNGLRSICARGSRCTFAHSISELEPLTVKPYSYFHNRRYMRGGGGGFSRGGGAHQVSTVPSASSSQPVKNTPPTPRAGEQPSNEKGQYEVGPDFLPNFDFLAKVLRSQIDLNTERGSSTSPSLRDGATSTATTTLSSQCVVPGSSPSSSSTCSSSVPRFPPAPEELRSAYSKSTLTTNAAFSNKNNSLLSSSPSPCGSSASSLSSSSEVSFPGKYPIYPMNNEVTKEEAKAMNLFHQQQSPMPEANGAVNRSDNRPDVSVFLPSLRNFLKGGSHSIEVQQHPQNRLHERSQPGPLPDVDESASIMKAVSLFQGLYEASSNITSSMMTRASPVVSQRPPAWPRPPPASPAHSQYFSPVSHSLGDSNCSGIGSFGGGSAGDGAGSDMTCENGGGRGTPLRKTRRGKRGGRKKRGGGSLYPHGFIDDETQASQLTGGDDRDDCGIDHFPQDDNNHALVPSNSSPVPASGPGFHGDEREGDGRNSVMTAALWGGREGLDRQHIHSQVPGHNTVDLERALRAAVTPAALVAKGISELSAQDTRSVDTNAWYAVASQLASSVLQQQKHTQNTIPTMATSAVGGGVDAAGSKREDG